MNALRRHPFALQLAIFAVLLRAMLPGGFMPVRAADGSGVAMVLCSESIARRVVVSHEHDDTARVLHGACVYAAAAAPALPPQAFSFKAAVPAATPPASASALLLATAEPHRRPPARAPPLRA